MVKLVAPMVGGVKASDGTWIAADEKIDGGPSVVFDAVAVLLSDAGAQLLTDEATARDFVADAFSHCKFMRITQQRCHSSRRPGSRQRAITVSSNLRSLPTRRALSKLAGSSASGSARQRSSESEAVATRGGGSASPAKARPTQPPTPTAGLRSKTARYARDRIHRRGGAV